MSLRSGKTLSQTEEKKPTESKPKVTKTKTAVKPNPETPQTTIETVPDHVLMSKMLPFLNNVNAATIASVSKRMQKLTMEHKTTEKYFKKLVAAAAGGLKLSDTEMLWLMIASYTGNVTQHFIRVFDFFNEDSSRKQIRIDNEVVGNEIWLPHSNKQYIPQAYDTLREFLQRNAAQETIDRIDVNCSYRNIIENSNFTPTDLEIHSLTVTFLKRNGNWSLSSTTFEPQRAFSRIFDYVEEQVYAGAVGEILNIINETQVVVAIVPTVVNTRVHPLSNLLGHNNAVKKFVKPRRRPKGQQLTNIISIPRETPWRFKK